MNGVLSRELLKLFIIDREFILIKRARVRDLEGKSHPNVTEAKRSP
jgi:hypothetical protein